MGAVRSGPPELAHCRQHVQSVALDLRTFSQRMEVTKTLLFYGFVTFPVIKNRVVIAGTVGGGTAGANGHSVTGQVSLSDGCGAQASTRTLQSAFAYLVLLVAAYLFCATTMATL
jgi:hypothetical protein